MVWKNQWWTTALQERLNEESSRMNAAAAEEAGETPEQVGLSFGPYGSSPLRGLHFETSEDTAAS